MIIQQDVTDEKFPKVSIGEIIHFHTNGFCVPAIISGVPEQYESNGELVIHPFVPAPAQFVFCHGDLPKYSIKKEKDTWHKADGCIAKKLPVSKEHKPRLIH